MKHRKNILRLGFLIVFVFVFSFTSVSQYPSSTSAQVAEVPKYITAGDPALPGGIVSIEIPFEGGEVGTRQPADIMLVMDFSTSMTGSWPGGTKIDGAKQAMMAFVAQTTDRDFVGLITYQMFVNSPCRNNIANCARVRFPLTQMTDANKNALIAFINSLTLPAVSNTPIGSGLELANRTLATETAARNTIDNFIVLATDGFQNSIPSPFERWAPSDPTTILGTAQARGTTIYSVGIGDDVNFNTGIVANCLNCPDIHGFDLDTPLNSYLLPPNGFSSGAEIMKEIACRGDVDCDKTLPLAPAGITNACDRDHTGVSTVNDMNCPSQYYYADGSDSLRQIYVDIANDISSGIGFVVYDVINGQVFNNIVPGSIHVVNCSVAPNTPWSHQVFPNGANGFMLRIDPVPLGTTVCVRFDAVVKNLPTVRIGTSNINSSFRYSAVIPPDATCNDIDTCALLFNNALSLTRIRLGSITVLNPAKPYLRVENGILGSVSSVSNIERDGSIRFFPEVLNKNFLTISNLGIDNNFDSLWEIEDYNSFNGIDLHITNYENDPSRIYETLYNNSRKKCGGDIPTIINLDPSTISTEVSATCNVVGIVGNQTINNAWNYTGDPAVVFVDGNLTIEKNTTTALDTGVIFIVEEDIVFQTKDVNGDPSGADNIDGIYIAQGKIFSSESGETDEPSGAASDDPLLVHGALYSFDQFLLTRSLADNENTPSEEVIFDPKYLFLFSNILGDVQSVYSEVAP